MLNLDYFGIKHPLKTVFYIILRELHHALRTTSVVIFMAIYTVVSPVAVMRMDNKVVIIPSVMAFFNFFPADITLPSYDYLVNRNVRDFFPLRNLQNITPFSVSGLTTYTFASTSVQLSIGRSESCPLLKNATYPSSISCFVIFIAVSCFTNSI